MCLQGSQGHRIIYLSIWGSKGVPKGAMKIIYCYNLLAINCYQKAINKEDYKQIVLLREQHGRCNTIKVSTQEKSLIVSFDMHLILLSSINWVT